jgi:hypothetical protein
MVRDHGSIDFLVHHRRALASQGFPLPLRFQALDIEFDLPALPNITDRRRV